MYNFKLCLLLCVLITFAFSQRNPGLVMSMKHNLIDDLKLKFLPQIIKNISEQNLPDLYFNTNVPVLGDITVVIKNFHLSISNLFADEIQTNLKDPNRIIVSVRGPNGCLTGSAEIKTQVILPITIISDILAEIKNINVDVEAKVERTESPDIPEKMSPIVRIESINFIGAIDIKVTLLKSSIANNILNALTGAFIKMFNFVVKDIVKNIINTVASNEIPKIFRQVPLAQEIPFTGLVIDNSMIIDPYTKDDTFVIGVDATVYEKDSKNENLPISGPVEIPLNIEQNDKLLQIFITDYVFNSFSYSLFKVGKLSNILIEPKIFDKFNLNVLAISVFWPQLLFKYRLDRPVKFDCGCLSQPLLRIQENNLEIDGDLACSLIVNKANGEDDRAFKLEMKLLFVASLVVENGKIKIQLNSARLTEFKTLESKIGTLYLKILQGVINFILSVGKPFANNLLSKSAIPIPNLLDFDLSDANLELHNNYVEINVNPVLPPKIMSRRWSVNKEFNETFQNNLKDQLGQNRSTKDREDSLNYWFK